MNPINDQKEFEAICLEITETLEGAVSSNLAVRVRKCMTGFLDDPILLDVKNNDIITISYHLEITPSLIRSVIGKVKLRKLKERKKI